MSIKIIYIYIIFKIVKETVILKYDVLNNELIFVKVFDKHNYKNPFCVNNNVILLNYDNIYVSLYDILNDTTKNVSTYDVYNIFNKNSNNIILVNKRVSSYDYYYHGITFDYDAGTITEVFTSTIDARSSANINNEYLITVSGTSDKDIVIYELANTENNTTYNNLNDNSKIVFANDYIFCYYDKTTQEIYKLSVEEYKNSTDKGSLNWVKIADNIDGTVFYLSNEWFAFVKNKVLYYTSVEFFDGYNGHLIKEFTQTELLYNINKKLDTLQDLLKQFQI